MINKTDDNFMDVIHKLFGWNNKKKKRVPQQNHTDLSAYIGFISKFLG